MKKRGCILFIINCFILFLVLYDTVIKYLLDEFGVFHMMAKLLSPNINFYWISYGFMCIWLIPVSIVLLCVNLHKNHTSNDDYAKRRLVISVITLIYQFVILIIGTYNNGLI